LARNITIVCANMVFEVSSVDAWLTWLPDDRLSTGHRLQIG
jgi:hypothetical protein